jgi:hypothetical protein
MYIKKSGWMMLGKGGGNHRSGRERGYSYFSAIDKVRISNLAIMLMAEGVVL